jgi:photosystem I subunit 3
MYVADGLAASASLPPSAPTSTTASTMFTAAPTAGPDGLPPLISDPGLAVRYGHAGETFIATRGFLYIAGYIGTAGRTYLQETRGLKRPTDNAFIDDVPRAAAIAARSWSGSVVAFGGLPSSSA